MGKSVCIILTDENFDGEVLRSRGLVMVYFWADWCGACHMIFPVIEALASDFQGRIEVGKLDIDRNPRVAAQYGIPSTPTLLFFRNGRLVDHVVGVAPKRVLAEKLHALLRGT